MKAVSLLTMTIYICSWQNPTAAQAYAYALAHAHAQANAQAYQPKVLVFLFQQRWRQKRAHI